MGDAELENAPRARPRDVLAEKGDAASRRRKQARDCLECGGLASAVGADQCDELTLLCVHGEPTDSLDLAVAADEPFNAEHVYLGPRSRAGLRAVWLLCLDISSPAAATADLRSLPRAGAPSAYSAACALGAAMPNFHSISISWNRSASRLLMSCALHSLRPRRSVLIAGIGSPEVLK